MRPERTSFPVADAEALLAESHLFGAIDLELTSVAAANALFDVSDAVAELQRGGTWRRRYLGIGLRLALLAIGSGLIGDGEHERAALLAESSQEKNPAGSLAIFRQVVSPARLAKRRIENAEPHRHLFDSAEVVLVRVVTVLLPSMEEGGAQPSECECHDTYHLLSLKHLLVLRLRGDAKRLPRRSRERR